MSCPDLESPRELEQREREALLAFPPLRHLAHDDGILMTIERSERFHVVVSLEQRPVMGPVLVLREVTRKAFRSHIPRQTRGVFLPVHALKDLRDAMDEAVRRVEALGDYPSLPYFEEPDQ